MDTGYHQESALVNALRDNMVLLSFKVLRLLNLKIQQTFTKPKNRNVNLAEIPTAMSAWVLQ